MISVGSHGSYIKYNFTLTFNLNVNVKLNDLKTRLEQQVQLTQIMDGEWQVATPNLTTPKMLKCFTINFIYNSSEI
jgi:hypothetical protein